MFPVICQIGPISIYSYGMMMAIAIVVCVSLFSKDAKQIGLTYENVVDFTFWVVLSGILGARMYFILLNVNYFIENPLEIIMVQKGGLAWQGGLVAGCISTFVYIRKKKWPFLKILDLVAPYIALGQAIGRIGCFLNGCCYGRHLDWGIYFPVHEDHLHPTQLYCSLGLFIIYFVLKKYQTISKKEGMVFIGYLVLASLLRFVIEFFRADHTIVFFGLSIFQIFTLIIIVIALYAQTRLESR